MYIESAFKPEYITLCRFVSMTAMYNKQERLSRSFRRHRPPWPLPQPILAIFSTPAGTSNPASSACLFGNGALPPPGSPPPGGPICCP